MDIDIWQGIEQLNQEFQELGFRKMVDYEKYCMYFQMTHSTT